MFFSSLYVENTYNLLHTVDRKKLRLSKQLGHVGLAHRTGFYSLTVCFIHC